MKVKVGNADEKGSSIESYGSFIKHEKERCGSDLKLQCKCMQNHREGKGQIARYKGPHKTHASRSGRLIN